MTERELEIRERIAEDRTKYRDTLLTLQESHIIMNALWKLEGYEKKNKELRERLNKVIELPFFQKDGEVITLIYKNKDGTVLTETYIEDEYYDGKRGNEVAEARLAELKGEDRGKER